MSKLFLFSLTEIFSQISLDLLVLVINAVIIFASVVCIILSIVKSRYGVKNRLWIVFFMVGINLVQTWIELVVNGRIQHLFLTVGICVCLLSIILFLPQKHTRITEPQRNLARFISNSITEKKQLDALADDFPKESKVISSPIIKTEPKSAPNNNKNEIEFSHVKSVLNKLEYYPLKEQDKKQAKELENAIYFAEQNGLSLDVKEKINDGLGALLKIMSKYAI